MDDKSQKIEYWDINDVIPYDKNPRKNENAVAYVANSIREFGFRVPIVVDKNRVIINGHTRLKAAQSLGMTEVPVIVAEDLTEEQAKAYRIADNKTADKAYWDEILLKDELFDLEDFFDMKDFGFEDWELGLDEDLFSEPTKDLEETYKEPEIKKLRCPHCGEIDSASRFMKAS